MTLRQREPRIELPKLRKSAKDKPCTMGSPMCNGDSRTTSWCHSDHEEHGKGVGCKAHDFFGFYGCSGCHEWYDTVSRREGIDNDTRRYWFNRAMCRSLVIAFMEGVLK
jgi:hypothetical protein